LKQPRTSSFANIARLITGIAWILLAGAGIAFVWAIAFTKGIEPLINTLLIALLGFFVPSLFLFWVAWVIGGPERDAAGDEPEAQAEGAEVPGDRSASARYAFAAATVALAGIAHALFAPALGQGAPFQTFLLAVAASAWFGGMGPAIVANALSLLVAWYWFVSPVASIGSARIGDVVGLGLFCAIAMAIAGMTSSLRAARQGAMAATPEPSADRAARGLAVAPFPSIADDAPAMIWMTDADGQCVHVNRAAIEFTGRPLEHHLRRGWIDALHPDDVEAALSAYRRAVEQRRPFRTTFRLRRRDGAYRTVLDVARPRLGPGGEFLGYVGAGIDLDAAPVVERDD
jgi:PAS domain S-box-containing protein